MFKLEYIASMAIAFATFEKPTNFSLHEVLNKSNSLAQRNKMNLTFNEIPVVTFTTLIDNELFKTTLSVVVSGLKIGHYIGRLKECSNLDERIANLCVSAISAKIGIYQDSKIFGLKRGAL